MKRVAFFLLLISSSLSAASKMTIDVTIPELNVNPYHRPYVAVWLEDVDRKYVTTIALWADDMEWYKDLRQWWRKAGRSQQPFDGVTGATKKPGKYKISWSGQDAFGKSIVPGQYLLKIEASREEGGREFIKTKITIDQQSHITLQGNHELGPIVVSVNTKE
jgi:hypothetical protein